MRSASLIKLPFLLLALAIAAHCQPPPGGGPPPQTVNPHTQIKWPANCANTPGMSYNYTNNTCVESGHQIEVTWDTTQPDLANNYVACMGTNGAHRCPTNASAWSGIQIGNGPGSGAATSTLAVNGHATCQFDGTSLTVGDFVQLSGLTKGTCHDTGSTVAPTNAVPIIGQIVANVGTTTAVVLLSSTGGSGPMGPAGPPGGSLSYPGVVSDNNNGMAAQGAVTAAAMPGYKASPEAPVTNRDQTLAVTATPQQFCPNAGNGITSDSQCFWKAMRWLASYNTTAPKRLIIPWTPQGYMLLNTDYCCLATMPYDFGDYHGSAGYATQAQANVYFSGGFLTGCNITGGSGYAPNAKLPIQILDPNHSGSGAAAYVLTNASGVPASTCVVQLQGINYPNSGVYANIHPLGGDGAAGTCVYTSGAANFSSCTLASPNLGYGYSTSPLPNVMITGLTGCSVLPVFTATVSGAQITGVTVTTPGTNCVLPAADTNAGAVPLVFGASCNIGGTPGQQCVLMNPEQPVNQPVSIPIYSGVQIVGVGNPTLSGECAIVNTVNCGQSSSYAPPAPVCNGPSNSNCIMQEAAIFGDPWGDQVGAWRDDYTNMGFPTMIPNPPTAPLPSVSNLTVDGVFGFWLPILAGGSFNNVTFAGGVGAYIGTIQGYSYKTAMFRDDIFTGVGGLLIAGDWAFRSPGNVISGKSYGYSGGSRGGTLMGHFNKTALQFVSYTYGGIGSLAVESPQVYYGAGFDVNFDKWIEQYLWKSQNSPATPYTDATHQLSNASTSCPTQIAVANTGRAVENYFGYSANIPNQGYWDYPWFNCFRGVRNTLVMAQPRYSYITAVINPSVAGTNDSLSFRFINARLYQVQRPFFEGAPQMVEIRSALGQTGGFVTDPYMPVGVTGTAIWLLTQGGGGAGTQGVIEDVNIGAFGANRAFQSLFLGFPMPAIIANTPSSNVAIAKLNIRNVQSLNDHLPGTTTTTFGVLMAGTQLLNNQTNIVTQPSSTNLQAGTYRASEYGWVTTPQTGAVMSLCLQWNDGTTSSAVNCPVSSQPATSALRYSYSQTFHSAQNGFFNFQNTCNSSAACSIDWVLERLQ